MKILIVDDYTALTAGLAALITDKWPDAEIHFAQTSNDAIRIVRAGTHLVLINPHLNGIAPFEIAAEIKRYTQGRFKVAFLMEKPCIVTARRVVAAKMDGIVLKSDSKDGFYHSLRTILSGHRSFPPELADQLYKPEPEDPTLGNLTPKEVSTLTLMGHGMTMKEIAGEMGYQ